MVEIHGEERNIDDRMTLAQPIRYFNHPRRAVIAVRRRLDNNSVVTVATGADLRLFYPTVVFFYYTRTARACSSSVVELFVSDTLWMEKMSPSSISIITSLASFD